MDIKKKNICNSLGLLQIEIEDFRMLLGSLNKQIKLQHSILEPVRNKTHLKCFSWG